MSGVDTSGNPGTFLLWQDTPPPRRHFKIETLDIEFSRMAIPDYQSLMLPLLKHTSDGKEHPVPSLVDALAADYKLTDAERRELLPSAGPFVFGKRPGWARTTIKKSGRLS